MAADQAIDGASYREESKTLRPTMEDAALAQLHPCVPPAYFRERFLCRSVCPPVMSRRESSGWLRGQRKILGIDVRVHTHKHELEYDRHDDYRPALGSQT